MKKILATTTMGIVQGVPFLSIDITPNQFHYDLSAEHWEWTITMRILVDYKARETLESFLADR